MTINEIAKILINNYKCCDAEYCENNDSVDVAIVFENTPEVCGILGDYVTQECEDSVWVWAIFNNAKDLRATYYLTGMESGENIPAGSDLEYCLLSCFSKGIRSVRRRFIKEEMEQLYPRL